MARRTLLLTAPLLFASCHSIPIERPAPGQPTMNELMHRDVERSRRLAFSHLAPLTPQAAEQLREELALDTNNIEIYSKVAAYYSPDELSLWFAQHHPDANLFFNPPDPHRSPAAYNRAKAIWTAQLRHPSSPNIYSNAAAFFRTEDPARAEAILQAGRKAFPADTHWPSNLGALYAQILTHTDPPDATLLNRLTTSTDAPVLSATAGSLLRRANMSQIATQLTQRALSLDPNDRRARIVQSYLRERDPNSTLLPVIQTARIAWIRQSPDLITKSKDLLQQAARNPNDPLAPDAILEANLILGKAALRRSDPKTALRYLAAAAAAPTSNTAIRAQIDMSLPRALIDWGYRTPVAAFLDQIAPQTPEPQRYHDWANAIRQGINPNLAPYTTGCPQDPC